MTFFPSDMPGVEPNMDDAGFWASCNQRVLAFQGCARCGVQRHPPTPMCGACRSTEVKWVEAPPRAQVYSYTVVHHAAHPAVTANLPYVVAVVTFEGLPGVRLVTNVTEIAPAEVRIGMNVSLWWDSLADARLIPRFHPDSSAGARP
jgi:uncharacterized OB-fold protein